MTKKLFLPLWATGSLLLFLYSYTQVDLSLTLSRASIFQDIQKAFQYVGWFNRPLSAFLYICIFTFLFILYLQALNLISKRKIEEKTVWKVIIIVTIIGTLSYNAFSYDLFNYIFDAKIVTFYHQNPYIHKALDFPSDPMLSFMRWTHRVYPYGPLWLGVTVPISFIGSQIFIVTYFLFKILMGTFFLLTVWAIGKIGKTLRLADTLLPVVAFALNPFIISEGLVSAHNDIVMMGFAMIGIHFLLKKEHVKGSLLFVISIGIKFATALLLMAFFILWGTKRKEHFIGACLLAMVLAVILATLRTTFQPWYLLYLAPFAVFFIGRIYIKIPLFIISIGAVSYYIPFLYTGNWDPPIPSILNFILLTTVLLAFLSTLVGFFLSNKPGIKVNK